MGRGRAAGLLAVIGVLAGSLAAAASAGANADMCRSDGECFGLVRTLSLRVGVVTAAATVLIVLLVMGLARMTAHEEERRLTEAGRNAPD